MNKGNSVLMLAYAQYYNDARIKGYVRALLEAGIAVDLICLRDPHSTNTAVGGVPLSITFVQKKYQGESAVRYLVNYILFFARTCFLVTGKYFHKRHEVIHVHNQPDFLVLAALVPKFFGAMVILDMHDVMMAAVLTKFQNGARTFLYRLTKFQTWISVKMCDILICADHSQKEFLCENGIVHPCTAVMMNLPDDQLFTRRGTIPHHPIIRLIYHGTLSYRLGLDLAIRAVEKGRQAVPLTLTIIGDGEQKRALIRYCEEKKLLHSIVEFSDFVPVEQLQGLIEEYDIGIVANRRSLLSERCMLPVKLMEYLAVGLPVVVPRLPVIQRYFTEDMVSYYEPEDVNEMSERIAELAASPNLRLQKVQNAGLFFKKHAWKEQAMDYLTLVQSNRKASH
ncbi:MAG: glycosyltransferase [Bacteroidota bacterium]|jgi:glycosyltransferase involved in cell wall biosynthesis